MLILVPMWLPNRPTNLSKNVCPSFLEKFCLLSKDSETVEFEPGSYVIVPTTFNAGEQTDFTLSFTSQNSVKEALALQELR